MSLNRKRTFSMGSSDSHSSEHSYQIDMSPTETEDASAVVVIKKKNPASKLDFKPLNVENIQDFSTYEKAKSFLKLNRMKYV